MFSNQLDNYEAEIVEDIPEQFDLSRYKKPSKSQNVPFRSPGMTPTPTQQAILPNNYAQTNLQQNSNYMYRPQAPNPAMDNSYNYNTTLDLYAPQMVGYDQKPYNKMINSTYDYSNYQNLPPKSAQNKKVTSSSDMLSTQIQPQQFVQYPGYLAYQLNQPIIQQQATQIMPHQQHQQYVYNNMLNQQQQQQYYPKNEFEAMQISQYQQGNTSTLKKKNVQNQSSINYHDVAPELKPSRQQTSSKPPKPETGRKKNSFDDDSDENSDPYRKKEYFLKGGEDSMNTNGGSGHGPNTVNLLNNQMIDPNFTNTLPKSSLKPAVKKQGVTFDEKLEVYEVKNPHYGLDVKSEKREMKKKRKDKQKEEEVVIKTKLDLKSKIQNQNMIHFYYYEKTLVYNALVFYEENFYKTSIIKLQDKLRSSKPDEKLRDQLVQIIEKDNQITVDIIKHVKTDYLTKLEPYLNQYQTTVDKLHAIPGMYQVIQSAANSVNYSEIINYHLTKDTNESPSGLRKILGHEAKIEKYLANNQTTQIKPSVQRKADLWLPKYLISAVDSHVRDVCFANYKNITDIIYKLNEICESDLNIVRAIYKYLLNTQLEPFRRNDTGSLIMRNYDLGIESTNTIFSRLCSFAGIENHLVRGLWKTICQDPGEKVETKSIWNIVNLESGWRFIQPAFTPVKYYLRRPEIGYEETEFYFLSDADSLFSEFLPNDKIWHFNESSVNKEYIKEFEKKPIITPQFRSLNLSLLNANYKNANIGKEPFKLAIKYPAELADSINFKYVLKSVNSSSESSSIASNQLRNNSLLTNDSNQNYELNNANLYVISELVSDENAILFKISALPEIGNYHFTIYASLSEDLPPQSSSLPSMPYIDQECKAILAIKLTCSKVTHFEIPPNRISDINMFGTNLMMKRLGLTCCDFKQGILGTDREGKLNLVFEMSQPLDIEAYLYSSDQSISSKCLELCILKRVVHNFLIIIINPPHAGLYGLDLHGAPKGTFNSLLHSQLPPIGKFLIKCHYQLKSFYQFPKGDNRTWGPKQRFYDLGLHTMGHIDPYIVNEDGKQIEIEIAMLKSLTLWYKFDFDQNGSPKAIDNFCFMNYKNSNKKEKTVSFLLRFPYRGFYHLAIMATDDIFPTNPDEIVYNYLIRVQDPSNDVEPFPIVLDPILWKDCCLIAPKNYRLNSHDVHFSILVPRTNQVQISNGENDIDKLEPKEIENSWVGLVTVNDTYSKFVYIEAEFENKFKRLVKFRAKN